MKPKNLRIGNTFQDEFTETIIHVIGLTDEKITFTGHFKNDWQAVPVRLTEERLLDFGFRARRFDEFIYKINNITSLIIQGKKFQPILIQVEDKIHLPKIEYVHQLQNLFFALTNEELIENA